MERWDLYNEQGEKTGRTIQKGEPLSIDEFHLAMEAWIVNHKGQVLIQQRSQSCEILPGIWGLTTGRMVAGEDTRSGCVRELREELGLQIQPERLRFLRRILRLDGTHLIWDLYLLEQEIELGALKLQPEEVSGAMWASAAKLREMIRAGELFFYPEIWEVLEYLEARAYRAEQLTEPEEKIAAAGHILEQLGGWFESAQARQEYEQSCAGWEVFTVSEGAQVAGLLAVRPLSKKAAEIAVMGVAPQWRRHGIGKKLFWRCAQWCWQRGICYLQAKTLGEGHPDALYAGTRAFYQKMGFVPLECFSEIWGPENPCQIMVRHFGGDGIARP